MAQRGKSRKIHILMLSCVAGPLCAMVAFAAVPGSMPARPSTAPAAAGARPGAAPATRAVVAVQADAVLSGFPRNAAAINARSDARAMTIEGRVRDVRVAPAAAGNDETEVRIVLVGKTQAEESAPHFTCHMDKTAAEDAASLEPDTIIRLTGAIGGVTPAQDRIDLTGCHDLTVVGDLPLAQRAIGKWVANVRPEQTAPAEIRGHNLHLELALNGDNTFTEEVFDDGKGLRQIGGKWSAPKPKEGEEPALKLEPKSLLSAVNPASFDAGRLVLQPVGLGDLRLPPKMTWTRVIGTEYAYNAQAMKTQVMNWFGANTAVSNTQTLAQNLNTFITQQEDGNYYLNAGGALLKSNRPVQILVCAGKMFAFPFSDAQAQRSSVTARAVDVNVLPRNGVLMVPEAKIESILLENKNTLTVNTPLKARVTLRTFGRSMRVPYAVMMISAHGTVQAGVTRQPGPDPDTFDLSFDITRAGNLYAQPDPLGVVFVLARLPAVDDRGSDRRPRVISEPIAFLMDIAR